MCFKTLIIVKFAYYIMTSQEEGSASHHRHLVFLRSGKLVNLIKGGTNAELGVDMTLFRLVSTNYK